MSENVQTHEIKIKAASYEKPHPHLSCQLFNTGDIL